MPSQPRSRTGGRPALFFALALNLLAAAAFISSHSFVGGTPKASALRGGRVAAAAGNGHELEFQPFSSENVESSQTFSWKPMVAFVATVGLVASMSSAPVNAQTLPTKEERLAAAKVKEAEELAKIDAQELKGDSVSQGLGKSKKKKVVELKKPEKKAEAAPVATPAPAPAPKAAEAPKAAPAADQGFSLPNPFEAVQKFLFGSGAEAPKAAPAGPAVDEDGNPISKFYDPDEDLTWILKPNLFYFALVSGFMPVLFLVFYILGSLNII